MRYIPRSLLLIILLAVISGRLASQEIKFASSVIEYSPAPGQFINNPLIGTPEAAIGTAGQLGNPVSLGAYGGYIIYGFDQPVRNNPTNPFGVDFIIVGNAMDNNAEQGIVMVMKDVNKNGIPDDTWYEIRGSDHFLPGYRKNYHITYYNPGENTDVPWSDNIFSSGFVRKNSYHAQPYYPSVSYFPSVNPDSLVFRGSLLPGRMKHTNGIITSERSAFGYADNTPFKGLSYPVIPDNPYTPQVEGVGGDGVDISWAVDSNGEYINLDEIDFVKIYTGVNYDAGWIGEISTEVRGIVVVKPVEGVSGPTEMLMPLNMPKSISVGSTTIPEEIFFRSGRPAGPGSLVRESSAPHIISISGNKITGNTPGNAIIRTYPEGKPDVYYDAEIRVYQPSGIQLGEKFTALRTGENRAVSISIVDTENLPVYGANLQFSISDTSIVNVTNLTATNRIMLEGLKSGSAFIDILPSGFEELTERIEVNVYDPVPEVSCLFSMKIENQAIISRTSVMASNVNFLDKIDRKPEEYTFPSGYVSLASLITESLIANGLTSQSNTFRFRIDEKSQNELYLWQVGIDWEFIYGWGGYAGDDAYNSCWAATVNGRIYLKGFDKIPVKENDNVTLHFMEDISKSFGEIIIRELEDSDRTGMTRQFLFGKHTYHPDGNGNFTSNFNSLPNAEIQIKGPDNTNDEVLFTDANGKFGYDFKATGIHRIIPVDFPGEELIVFVGGTQISKRSHFAKSKVFPNPAERELYITMEKPGDYYYEVSTLAGSRVLSGHEKGNSRFSIPVEDIPSGMYIIYIQGADFIVKHKFIRK